MGEPFLGTALPFHRFQTQRSDNQTMSYAAKRIFGSLVGLALLAFAPAARAEVKPHGLFTDGAVLQRDMRVPVWGTARDGEKVTVSIAGQKATTTAEGGRWMVHLKSMKAGGPYTLKIAGDNTVEIHDVLVGEVYIASGQSNMEWPLAASAGG